MPQFRRRRYDGPKYSAVKSIFYKRGLFRISTMVLALERYTLSSPYHWSPSRPVSLFQNGIHQVLTLARATSPRSAPSIRRNSQIPLPVLTPQIAANKQRHISAFREVASLRKVRSPGVCRSSMDGRTGLFAGSCGKTLHGPRPVVVMVLAHFKNPVRSDWSRFWVGPEAIR